MLDAAAPSDAPSDPFLAPLLEALEAARAPIAQARGLPSALYTDAAAYDHERRRLFHGGWACIGFAHETPDPGDARPVELLGAPLLILRDGDGTLRVFENVCRHRGMILVESARKIEGAIRCPYHSWCYGRDGRLVATPHVGGPGLNADPAVDRTALGLREVPSRVWFGCVFVNVDGRAGPFEATHGALVERWRAFDRPVHGAADEGYALEVGGNWKLAVENYCESYHLPWVHPGLNSYSRLEDHDNIVEPGRYSGQITRAYRPARGDGAPALPEFDDLGPFWREGAEYVAAFPNLLLGAHRDHLFAMLLEPLGPERTRERVALFYADAAALEPAYAPTRAAIAQGWREVFLEDVGVVEGMQRGRRAPGFDGGRFAPAMDAPTHLFHAWVADRLLGA